MKRVCFNVDEKKIEIRIPDSESVKIGDTITVSGRGTERGDDGFPEYISTYNVYEVTHVEKKFEAILDLNYHSSTSTTITYYVDVKPIEVEE